MTRHKSKSKRPPPPKGGSDAGGADSSGNPSLEGTPPALDAIVDRVLAYKPPGSKMAKTGRGKKP